MPPTDLQPDVDEVLQSEDPAGDQGVVKVEVHSPVRTQALPRKAGATFTKSFSTTADRLLRADHRRASALIIPAADVYLSFTSAGAQTPSTSALIPSGTLFPVGATVDVWIAAVTGTAAVSIVTELWATGE